MSLSPTLIFIKIDLIQMAIKIDVKFVGKKFIIKRIRVKNHTMIGCGIHL
jgi:hypothetical protein